MENLVKKLPGIGLCLLIAVPAWFTVQWIEPLEVMGAPVLAILAGMLLTLAIPVPERAKSGIAFVSKKVLQAAVVLLGFGLNLSTVGKIGGASLPIFLSTIATSLIVAFVLQKVIHIPARTATLVGVGSSICGGSAIAATAPVIGADDDEIAQAISVIFLHCFSPQKPYTGGCVAIPADLMVTVMQNVDKDCVVVIDSLEKLSSELWEEWEL